MIHDKTSKTWHLGDVTKAMVDSTSTSLHLGDVTKSIQDSTSTSLHLGDVTKPTYRWWGTKVSSKSFIALKHSRRCWMMRPQLPRLQRPWSPTRSRIHARTRTTASRSSAQPRVTSGRDLRHLEASSCRASSSRPSGSCRSCTVSAGTAGFHEPRAQSDRRLK